MILNLLQLSAEFYIVMSAGSAKGNKNITHEETKKEYLVFSTCSVSNKKISSEKFRLKWGKWGNQRAYLHFQETAPFPISVEEHSYPQPGGHRVSQGLFEDTS